jgi:hypothetical protein
MQKLAERRVLGKNQAGKAEGSRPPGRMSASAMDFRRMALWGLTAVGAVIIAVFVSRSEVGAHRGAGTLALWHRAAAPKPPTAPPFDARAQVRRLTQTVQGLEVASRQLERRLTAVEHNMDNLTGSITRQIAAVKAERAKAANPWPANAAPTPPAVIAALFPPPTPAAAPAPPDAKQKAVAPTAPKAVYGVDVGRALSLPLLRARWLGIRSAHRELFAGLSPTAVLREIPGPGHAELRLVVGPLGTEAAAARICAELRRYRLFCRSTVFDAHSAALR